MYRWIYENPIPLLVLGLILQAVLGVVYFQTRRSAVLVAMVLLAITSAGLIILERYLVTPEEEITDTLHQIAAALESNDIPRVQAFISPQVPALRREAEQVLKQVIIQEAVLGGNLEIQLGPPDPKTGQPTTAKADFFARFRAKFLKDTSPYEQAVERFKVDLRHEENRWRVTRYSRSSR